MTDKNRFHFDHIKNRERNFEWANNFMSNTNGQRNFNNQEDLIDIKSLISLIKRRKWIILLSVVLTTSAAYYLAFEYMLPVYRSSSTIELVQNQNQFPGGGDNISRIIMSSFQDNGRGSLQNELFNFRSSEVTGVVAEQITDIKYQPNGVLYPILWTEFPEDSTLVDLSTVASRIRSSVNIEPVERGANILSISVQSYSPQEAARLTNLLVNRYLEWSNEKKRASASSAIAFIENEKSRVEQELNRAENRLGSFMNDEELIQLEAQASSSVNALTNLETEKKNVEIELASVNSAITSNETRLESIRPGLARQYSEAVGPTITRYQQELAELTTRRFVLLSNNPRLREEPNSEPELRRLNSQIAELQEEIERLSTNMLERNEGYLGFSGGGDVNLSAELAGIQSQLIQLRLQRSQLSSQLTALDERIEDTRMFLDRVPENRIQLARLEREVNAYNNLFTTLTSQAAEVTLWQQTMGTVGNIVNSAGVPRDPIKPEKEMMLAVGFLIGLFLPIGLFFLKENFSPYIKSIKDLEKYPYPLLTVVYNYSTARKISSNGVPVPSDKNIPENLVVIRDSASPLAESYRRLVNNIVYSYPQTGSKIYVVTSANQGEGKTSTVSNMAAAFTELGKQVLIIDCDLRRPGLHKFFNISSSPGVLEMVIEKQKENASVRATDIENLYLLTAGKKAPNPPSILGSDQMKDILKHAKSYFDVVLLDTAPYGIITDVAPLIELTDGIVMVARFGETKKVALQYALEQLDKTNTRIIGSVLNGYNPKKSQDPSETNQHYEDIYKSYYDYTSEEEEEVVK